jgi:hypothetical protein
VDCSRIRELIAGEELPEAACSDAPEPSPEPEAPGRQNPAAIRAAADRLRVLVEKRGA